MTAASPFSGFWMGGFEGADAVNAAGMPLDMVRASGHLDRLEDDHRRAFDAGLACVRESIGWRLAEAPGGRIDLSRAQRVADSAQRAGLQVAWTLMHYGVPADLSLHDDRLIGRFERFAAEAVRVLGRMSDRALVVTPVNEISFLAWSASQPGWLHTGTCEDGGPSSLVSGYDIKRRLARAAIAAARAMRAVDPRVRLLHIDPVLHVVPPADPARAAEPCDDWPARAAEVRSWQWQAWDLIAGRAEPALGGSLGLLDIVGVNHYHSSQWEAGTERRLHWHLRDPRRMPVAALMREAWQRYGRPLVLAETGHVGVGRADWLHDMAAQVRTAIEGGVPVQGLCLYPLIDRPDWEAPERWHRSGLWHVDTSTARATAAHDVAAAADRSASADPDASAAQAPAETTALRRVIDSDYSEALRAWQSAWPHDGRYVQAAPPARPHEGPQQHEGPLSSAAAASPATPPLLVVLSRRRWGTARHRMQQLARRLAGAWRVVFVEPARRLDGAPGLWLDHQPQGPWLDVLVPCVADASAAVDAAQTAAAMRAWIAARPGADPQPAALWLDTPDVLPLASALQPRAWVYDTAGPQAQADGDLTRDAAANAGRLAAHRALLRRADLVLHPGPHAEPSPPLADDLRAAGVRAHAVPNGTDAARFSALGEDARHGWEADEAGTLLAALHAGPRLVGLGTLDAHIDLALLTEVARARPRWQLLWIGAEAARADEGHGAEAVADPAAEPLATAEPPCDAPSATASGAAPEAAPHDNLRRMPAIASRFAPGSSAREAGDSAVASVSAHASATANAAASAADSSSLIAARQPHGRAGRPANLHVLGEQPWRLLPAMLATCDVALLPFTPLPRPAGLPLKLLDVLAAGLPVVASGFHELGRDLRPCGVMDVESVEEFIAACEACLAESPPAAQRRRAAAQAFAAAHDWDASAAELHRLLIAVTGAKAVAEAPRPASAPP